MRRGSTRCSIAAVVLLAACAHGPLTPPPELLAIGDPRCPLPLVWPSAEQAPHRVRIRNLTADSLTVDLDRCFRYTTLAPVGAGRTVYADLPPRLIAYPDGLRFHAFTGTPLRFVGSWHVPPLPGPTLDLVLDSASRAADGLFLYDLKTPPEIRTALHEDDQGKPYLMVPEVAEGGFLIWSCGGGRRWVSLSTSVKLPAGDSVEVATRFDGGDWSPDERWEVLRSVTDAALVPERGIDSLAVRAARAKLVNVRIVTRRYQPYNGRTMPPSTTTFGFRTEELRATLAGVDCFRDVLKKLR